MSIQNRSTTPALSPELGLDLPVAVRYVGGSGSYSTPDYAAGNARRLPDAWLDSGATLPAIGPGESIDVRFNVAIPPATRNENETVDIIAVLRSDEQNLRESLPLAITPRAELRMVVEHPTDVGAGDDVKYRVSVTNMGQTDLENVKFGIEGSCHAAYHPHSLWQVFNDGAYAIRSGDQSGPDNSVKGTDVTKTLLTLAAGETRGIVFAVHIAETTGAGTVKGPTILAFTDDASVVGQRQETDILVGPVSRPATAAELAAATKEIVEEIQDVTKATGVTADTIQDNTNAIKDATSTIGYQTEEIKEATAVLEAEAAVIENATATIKGQTGEINETTKKTLNTVVENLDPWDQSLSWILRLGGFAALASLIAGIVFPFLLVGVWKRVRRRGRRHRRRATSSDPLEPPSPSKWTRSTLWAWAADRCRAGVDLLAAARRHVRDWIDGLWRR